MKRVLLLLSQGVEILEAAAFVDVLGWATTYGKEKIATVSVGLVPELTSTFGLRLSPDAVLSEISATDFDALAVPGGFEEHGFYEHAFGEEVGMLIRSFARQDKPIAAICVGSLALGKSGILERRRATTYHLRGRRRQQLAEFGAEVVDEPIVRDGKIITSTSPATAVDVALALLALLTDQQNADRVCKLMGFAGYPAEKISPANRG